MDDKYGIHYDGNKLVSLIRWNNDVTEWFSLKNKTVWNN